MKPFECSMCKKLFQTRNGLRYHLNIHQGVKPYKCSVCKKEFILSGGLKRHERIHQGSYKCPVCKELFSNSRYLKCHEKIHRCQIYLPASVISKPEISINSSSEDSNIHCKKGTTNTTHNSDILSNESKYQNPGALNLQKIKIHESVLCKEKFTIKYIRTNDISSSHGNSKLNSSCTANEKVSHKKPNHITHIKIFTKEDKRLRNQNFTNTFSNFEKEKNGFVQNFELKNRVLQEMQPNEHGLPRELVDIKTEELVSRSEYELQANDSEFLEEIEIIKEEIPSDTEYEDSTTYQAEDLMKTESVYDNC